MGRAGVLLVFLAGLCAPFDRSSAQTDVCGLKRNSIQTALLLQKKGPEAVILEVDPLTGKSTGLLRSSIRLQGTSFSGFAADEFDQLHFIPSVPPLNVTGLDLNHVDQGTLSGAQLQYTNTSLGSVSNVWNVAPWETQGALLAVTPAPGYMTRVLKINTTTGAIDVISPVVGVPVRGIYASDRAGDRYWFVVSKSPNPALVTFSGVSRTVEVAEFVSSDFSTLVGIHFDETRCMLLGFFLRAPGLLGMRSLDHTSSPGTVRVSGELESLSPAASESAQALELIGMTHLVSGKGGPVLIVRDPFKSSASAFNIWGRTSYTFNADDVIGVSSRTLLAPRVASVHPASVGMTGHAVLTIVGTRFGLRDSTPSVEIGGTPSADVSWVSDTMITAVVPATSSKLPLDLLADVKQVVKVSLLGATAGSDEPLSVIYVPSWHAVSPRKAPVTGGALLSISGGRFAPDVAYACSFGGLNTTVATRVNDLMVRCAAPFWPKPAGEVALELIADGTPAHADGAGAFLFVAGQPQRMELVRKPWYLLGGLVPEQAFAVAVRDVAGNDVLDTDKLVDLSVHAVPDMMQAAVLNRTVGATDGVATFGDVSIDKAGNYSFKFTTFGLADIFYNFTVYVGETATLDIEMPSRVLAGAVVLPLPTVKAVDAGGNVVAVDWHVSAALDSVHGGESFQATDIVLAAGQGLFIDLVMSKSGLHTVVFTSRGIAVRKMVTVLPSSPVRVYNAVSMPSGQHPSLKPVLPSPMVRVLDVARNHIQEQYWTQETNGSLTPHYLDVEVTARLVTAFSNISSGEKELIGIPSSFPAGIVPWEYHLYGVTSVRLLSNPAQTAACPRDCFSHGSCRNGMCACDTGYQGIACERPSNATFCRPLVCPSRLGYYYGGKCHCQVEADIVFATTQVGGSANFTGLMIDRKADGYVLMFTSPGLATGSTLAFSVVFGDATQLGLISQPYGNSKPLGGYGGVRLANSPIVEIRDGGGNLVRTETVTRTVRVSLENRGNGAVLVGENSTAAVKGLATFDKVAVDLVGSDYVLVFSCDGLIATSSENFTVTYGPPYSIAVVVQPGGAHGGEALTQQPRVEVRDVGTNVVLNASLSVRASLLLPSGSTATISSGGRVAVSAEGVAAFTDLAVDLVGTGYKLMFTSINMSDVDSSTFAVDQGSASRIDVIQQPGNASGGFLGKQPVVKVYDAGGNWVTDKRQLIDVYFVNKTGMFSNTSVAGRGWSEAGMANFTDLAVGTVGANFSLVFRSANVTNAPLFYSAKFDVVVGEPYSFKIVQQPPNSWAGDAFIIQPHVVLGDKGGNIVVVSHQVKAFLSVPDAFNRTLDRAFATTLARGRYNGSTCITALDAPVLSGTDTFASDSFGVARFTNLSVNVAAPGYRLRFVSLSNLVTGATSDLFSIKLAPGQPDIIRVVCTPRNETAAVSFLQQPVIEFVDRGGNRRHLISGSPAVSVTLVEMPGASASLTGSFSAVAFGDLSSYTNLAIGTAGSGFVLKFSSPGYTSGYSRPFSVLRSGPAALSIKSSFVNLVSHQPQIFSEGGVNFGLDVYVVDKGGNIAADTRNVTIEMWKNVQETRTFTCTGDQSCTSKINASVPVGARLVSAKASIGVQCTDLDNPAEYIKHLSIASVPLGSGEFNSGPWEGCARSCSSPETVLLGYDIVRKICWSSDQETACARLVVAATWDPEKHTSWDFFQQMAQASNAEVPLNMEVTPDVNFYPCDGHFLNAEVTLNLEYSVPIPAGGSDGTLSGTKTKAAVNGVASFGDFSIDRAGFRYTLKSTALGMVAAYSFPFPVVPGPVAELHVHVQPGDGTGNSTLSTQPRVYLFDSVGNRVDRSDVVHAILIVKGAEDTQGYLKGTASVVAVNGAATFTDLFVGPVGTYVLKFTSASAAPKNSTSFNVVKGPPYKIGFKTHPGGSTGGDSLSKMPVAAPQDWSRNFVSMPNGSVVTVSIGQNGGVIGQLSGTKTAILSGDMAAFTGLSIDKVGQGYTLVFSMAGLQNDESEPFDIRKGPASKIVVIRQPKRSTANQLLAAPQPAVAVTDNGGNTITDWAGNVTVSISTQGQSPHPSMPAKVANLTGTLQGYFFDGVFYFWNLRIDQVGIGIVLAFNNSDPSFSAAFSDPFSVYGDTARSLSVFVQPSMTKASVAPKPVVVAAVDINGDVDYSFSGLSFAKIASASSSSLALTASQGVPFAAGIASFTDLIVRETGSLSLNITAGALKGVVTSTYEVIDPWTGWWVAYWPRPEAAWGFFMKHVGPKVEAVWRMNGDRMRYASNGAPLVAAGAGCGYSVGQVFRNGVGAGSFLLDNCGGDVVNVTSAMETLVAPRTAWAKDVEHFTVEEYYPARITRNYVVVANSFDGTSYTTESALYEWKNANLEPVTPSPFQGTKGAHSWKHFMMGGNHHLIVANHYDDQGNGFGPPSIIYRLQYSLTKNKNVFTAIQSISTSGAASWDSFEIGEDTFLAVANYFNGSHFDINSKVFKLARTNPDATIPRVVGVQAIPTSGARCVEAFDIGGVQHLAYGNRWGGNIKVYRWDQATETFVLLTTIASRGVLSIDSFAIGDKAYLAVANIDMASSGSIADESAVYLYSSASSSFVKLHALGTPGSSDVKHFVHQGLHFLALANTHNLTASNGSSAIYRWNGAEFAPLFDLPSMHAYAVSFFTVPCLTNASDGQPCGFRTKEDIIVAANGWGVESMVFSLGSFNLTLEASHVEVTGDSPSSGEVASVLAPPTRAVIKNLGKHATSAFAEQRNVSINAEIFSEVVPPGTALALPRTVRATGTTSKILGADGTVLFDDIAVGASGSMSLRVWDEYLCNVSASMTKRFTLTSKNASLLQVGAVPPILNSSGVIQLVVFAVDALGNFQPGASEVVVTVSVDGFAAIEVTGGTAPLTKGVATFPNVSIAGIFSSIRFKAVAAGYASATSTRFDVAAPTYLQQSPAGASIPLLAGGTATSPGSGSIMYVFGGLDPVLGAVSNLWTVDTSTMPYTITEVQTSGRRRNLLTSPNAPPPRYDHVAVATSMGGAPNLFVIGGRNDTSAMAGVYRLDLATLKWTDLKIADSPARSRHSAVVGVPTTNGLPSADGTTTIVVFGGKTTAGTPLGDVRTYRVYGQGVTYGAAPVLVAGGDAPSPRWGALMAWVNGTCYVYGGYLSGDLSDENLYSLTLDYVTASLQYKITWAAKSRPQAQLAGSRPPTPLSNAPAVVDNKIYLVAPASLGSSNVKVYVLDPQASIWQPTLDAGSAAVRGPIYSTMLVVIAPGKVGIFLSTAGQNMSQALMLSFTASSQLRVGSSLPSGARAGQALSPSPRVEVRDGAGALVSSDSSSVVMASAYDSLGAKLPVSGLASVTTVQGVATFTTLAVDRNGTGIVLRFNSPALAPDSTAPFFISPGAIYRVVFDRLLRGITPGAVFAIQPVARIVDVAGNLVAKDSFSTLSAQLQKHDGNGVWGDVTSLLDGTKSITASFGYVTFTDLGISASSPPTHLFRFVVARTGVTPAVSAIFTFTGPSEVTFQFSTVSKTYLPGTNPCPSSTGATTGVNALVCKSFRPIGLPAVASVAFGGIPFKSQPLLRFELKGSNSLILPAYGGVNVTVQLVNSATGAPIMSAIRGNTKVLAVAGWANFTNLAVSTAGGDYKIRFDSAGMQETYSIAFKVHPGPPDSVAVVRTVERAPLAGTNFVDQPSVVVLDAGGNNVTAQPVWVTASILRPSGSNAVLTGNALVSTTRGTAIYTDLSIDKPGANFSILFRIAEACCSIHRNTSTAPFDVVIGQAYQLDELNAPGNATGGSAFGVQPEVRVLDAGGNPVAGYENTEVTAQIGQDNSIYFTVKSSPPTDPGTEIMDIEPFVFNGTQYVIVAKNYKSNAGEYGNYYVNSSLYIWNSSLEQLIWREDIPSMGAWDWKHFKSADGSVYLAVANNFRQVASDPGGVPLGVYATQSFLFKMFHGRVQFATSFNTYGATSLDAFTIGTTTMVAVSNSFDEKSNSKTVPSEIFRLSDRTDKYGSLMVSLNLAQKLPSSSALGLVYFELNKDRFLAIANNFGDQSYTTNSTIFMYSSGMFQPWLNVTTYGATAVKSFKVGARVFVLFSNTVTEGGGKIVDGGMLDIYEMFTDDDGVNRFALRQRVKGLFGIKDFSSFRLNQAEWVAVAQDPVGGTQRGGLKLLVWNVTNCPDVNDCAVNFTSYRSELGVGIQSVNNFAGISSNYIVYAGVAGIKVAEFKSLAGLTGTTVSTFFNGKATFYDLGITLAQKNYRIRYTAAGLLPADGGLFDVAVGPATRLRLAQLPQGARGGSAFATQPVVWVLDRGFNLVNTDTTEIQVNVTGGGSPRGAYAAITRAGVATFTDLSVDRKGQQVLKFQYRSLTEALATIDVVEGPPHTVVLDSDWSAVGQGGSKLVPQPVLKVVDRGGNKVVEHEMTVVDAVLDEKVQGTTLLHSSPFANGVHQAKAFNFQGVGYVVVRTGDENLVLMSWKCKNLVAIQNISFAGAWDIEVWEAHGQVWLAAAAATGLEMFKFDTSLALFAKVPLPLDVEANTVRAYAVNETVNFLALGRSKRSPFVHGSAGWQIVSWDGANMTVVQNNISLGGDTKQIEVKAFDGKYGERNWMVRSFYSNADTDNVTLAFYLWDPTVQGFVVFDQSALPEDWVAIGSGALMDYPSHEKMAAFPHFDAVGGFHYFSLLVDSTHHLFHMALSTNNDDTSGVLSFKAENSFVSAADANISSWLSAVGFRENQILYNAIRTPHTVKVVELANYNNTWTVPVPDAVVGSPSPVTYTVLGDDILLLVPTKNSLEVHSLRQTAAALSGMTSIVAVNGLATFTDLSIDLESALSYAVSFSIRSSGAKLSLNRDFETSTVTGYATITYGTTAALSFISDPVINVDPVVSIIDGGGNIVANDTNTSVTLVGYNPVNASSFKMISTLGGFSTSGAKRTAHFSAGGMVFVAVANQYDGVSYNIDSVLYKWDKTAKSLSLFQQLPTKASYDFAAFDLPLAAGVDTFLAVANHYDDVENYQTNSKVYRWNTTYSKFVEAFTIPTDGATHFEPFTVDGVHYLAVANFFDGTHHAVNSAIYRWTFNQSGWDLEVDVPFQELDTVAAHHMAFFSHNGENYLAVAQQWNELVSSFGAYSVVYKWDRVKTKFVTLGNIPTQSALQIEPFVIDGTQYIAVANSLNVLTGKALTNSTVYKMSCEGGKEQFTVVQQIATSGATRWRHFMRGGLHHLAVSQWVPQNDSKVVVYIWTGGVFEDYTVLTNAGAFDVDIIKDDTGYYFVETLPTATSSVVAQLVELDGDGVIVPPYTKSRNTGAGNRTFSAGDIGNFSSSLYWDTWIFDFFASDSQGRSITTGSGAYRVQP